MSQKSIKNPAPYVPPKCWVGDAAKVVYSDELDAENAARYNEARSGLKRGALQVYKCDLANHWHIANRKERR